MHCPQRHHRLTAVGDKVQPPVPADLAHTPQHLCRKTDQVPVGFQVSVRIDAKEYLPIGHRLNLLLCMPQFHPALPAGIGQQVIGISARGVHRRLLLKTEHIVITSQFQCPDPPVRLTDLKDSHRDGLPASVRKFQGIEKLRGCALQRIPVHIQK